MGRKHKHNPFAARKRELKAVIIQCIFVESM